ncbi:ProQ/FINO family protein [Thiothrix winogradskyi]|uniref:ProQ/FinO family protein n=1 Tax=Thiothrix winogradskyi TaxID=96472 RepID=A0ABY3T447_9GAMM|nr:ProQ/FINO family protein [Thiothrix winogradskyi]UJS26052.1 ProQ/FinO family protein [Thiothrix winogradskyi]
MNDPTPPRKTISITRKPANTGTPTTEVGGNVVKRTGKRIITRDQLPAANLTRPGKFEKPKPKPAKAKRKPRQPPKPPKTPPSELRARELSDSLNNFTIWRERLPLALGIEKQIFRHIADLHLSASKRVVSKMLHYHTHHRQYLLNAVNGFHRFNLDGSESGELTAGEKAHAWTLINQSIER